MDFETRSTRGLAVLGVGFGMAILLQTLHRVTYLVSGICLSSVLIISTLMGVHKIEADNAVGGKSSDC